MALGLGTLPERTSQTFIYSTVTSSSPVPSGLSITRRLGGDQGQHKPHCHQGAQQPGDLVLGLPALPGAKAFQQRDPVLGDGILGSVGR